MADFAKIDADIDFIPLTIATCCTLHNIAENNKIPLRATWTENLEESTRLYPQPINSAVSGNSIPGNAVRNHLKNYMAQHFPILQSRIH